MKLQAQKIRGKEEKTMKIMTAVKTLAIVATLGFACLLPTTARAQMDAMPDSFAFSPEEAAAAQPAQVVVAKESKADFEGKVSLPYAVKCAGKDLKAGQYLLSVRSEGAIRVITIRGGGENVNVHVRQVSAKRSTNHSALLVRKLGDSRQVEALYVEGLNATLYLNANSTGTYFAMERLPIS
jgi:hypothetical protein